MLPPISGGALDSNPPAPETEGGAALAPESPPAPGAVPTTAFEGTGAGFGDEGAARSQDGSVTAEPAPTGDHLPVPSAEPQESAAAGPIEGLDATAVSEVIEHESVSPAATSEPIAGPAADLDEMPTEPASTGDHLPVPSEESTLSAPTTEPPPTSVASDTTPEVPAASAPAPGGRPPRPGGLAVRENRSRRAGRPGPSSPRHHRPRPRHHSRTRLTPSLPNLPT